MNRPARYVLATVLLLLLGSCGTESDPPAKATATPSPTIGASHRGDIDVLDAVLVKNDDGSATLSARIVNHTAEASEISNAYVGEHPYEAAAVRFFRADNVIPAHGKTSTGGETDPVRIRVLDVAKLGTTVPLSLDFGDAESLIKPQTVALKVPVVARTSAYDAVAGMKPNTATSVAHGRIVLVRRLGRAYLEGTIRSTVDDASWELPTAVDAKGQPIRIRHQTATGGPYGYAAVAAKDLPIGGSPPSKEGDADYINADDVEVGDVITVTFPFQGGDVVAEMKVVAG